MRPIAEIMEEMLKAFRREPRGWCMLKTTDSKGLISLFFQGSGKLWEIKGEMKSPFELIGGGMRIADRIDDRIEQAMMGSEPLPFSLVSLHPKRKDTLIISAGVGRQSHRFPSEMLSPKQKKMDQELRQSLTRLMERLGLDSEYA